MKPERESRLPERRPTVSWRARTDDLVITETANDLLVYDARTHHLHHLNPLMAVIWRHLDGTRDLPMLVRVVRARSADTVTESSVELALHSLTEAGLLDDLAVAQMPVVPTGIARRRLLKQAAVGGLLLPTIVSVTAASAARAQSCVGIEGECRNDACCVGLECDPIRLLCLVPVIECEQQGSRCDEQRPCCDGLECRDTLCQPPVIDCVPQNSRCDEQHACCEGLECRDTMCQPPVEVPCVPVNDRCNGDDVCCGDATCESGICTAPPVDDCVAQGSRCDEGHPCCDGLECRDTMCQPPVEVPCVPVNDRCNDGDVCCGDAICEMGLCRLPPVDQCHEVGDVCKSTVDCCDGLTCLGSGICG